MYVVNRLSELIIRGVAGISQSIDTCFKLVVSVSESGEFSVENVLRGFVSGFEIIERVCNFFDIARIVFDKLS